MLNQKSVIHLRGRTAVIDDLDPAVLRLLHAVGGRNQQVALALSHDLDLGRRDPVLFELPGNRLVPGSVKAAQSLNAGTSLSTMTAPSRDKAFADELQPMALTPLENPLSGVAAV